MKNGARPARPARAHCSAISDWGPEAGRYGEPGGAKISRTESGTQYARVYDAAAIVCVSAARSTVQVSFAEESSAFFTRRV